MTAVSVPLTFCKNNELNNIIGKNTRAEIRITELSCFTCTKFMVFHCAQKSYCALGSKLKSYYHRSHKVGKVMDMSGLTMGHINYIDCHYLLNRL